MANGNGDATALRDYVNGDIVPVIPTATMPDWWYKQQAAQQEQRQMGRQRARAMEDIGTDIGAPPEQPAAIATTPPAPMTAAPAPEKPFRQTIYGREGPQTIADFYSSGRTDVTGPTGTIKTFGPERVGSTLNPRERQALGLPLTGQELVGLVTPQNVSDLSARDLAALQTAPGGQTTIENMMRAAALDLQRRKTMADIGGQLRPIEQAKIQWMLQNPEASERETQGKFRQIESSFTRVMPGSAPAPDAKTAAPQATAPETAPPRWEPIENDLMAARMKPAVDPQTGGPIMETGPKGPVRAKQPRKPGEFLNELNTKMPAGWVDQHLPEIMAFMQDDRRGWGADYMNKWFQTRQSRVYPWEIPGAPSNVEDLMRDALVRSLQGRGVNVGLQRSLFGFRLPGIYQ